jgi:hypothetical protein
MTVPPRSAGIRDHFSQIANHIPAFQGGNIARETRLPNNNDYVFCSRTHSSNTDAEVRAKA